MIDNLHTKEVSMTTNVQYKMATPVKWIARVIGLIASLYFLFWYTFFGIGSGLADHIPINANIIPPIVFGALVLVAYVVSWRHERFGGVLFILASIGVFIVPAFISIINAKPIWNGPLSLFIRNWAYLGLPLLIAGVLFLTVSWLPRSR